MASLCLFRDFTATYSLPLGASHFSRCSNPWAQFPEKPNWWVFPFILTLTETFWESPAASWPLPHTIRTSEEHAVTSFVPGLNDSMSGGMQLLPDPLFSIPTDNTYILSITSTDLGRIFMAGKDGCLYEIAYQAEAGWLSQRCRKINHSKSTLSFLVPSVLQFSFSEDGEERLHFVT